MPSKKSTPAPSPARWPATKTPSTTRASRSQPLILIAEFAARQNIDLYAYQSHDRTLRDAILFFGRAVADPTLVKPYTSDPQNNDTHPNDFAAFNFYTARFPADALAPSITTALQHPLTETRIGGNTTVLAAK